MIIARLAFRNIFRHRRRSLLTGIMMAGGCVLFATFIGMVDGSYDNIIDKFTQGHTAHLQIHASGYLDKPSLHTTLHNPLEIGRRIESMPHVRAWSPRTYGPALAFASTKTTGVSVMGVDVKREPQVSSIVEKVRQGTFLPDEPDYVIMISNSTARVLHVSIGDEVALISQGADGSIANDLFTVIGIIDDLGNAYDRGRVFMHMQTAREFYVLDGQAHEIAVQLDSHRQARSVAAEIDALNGDLGQPIDADPWQVVEKAFYQAMQADIEGNWITMVVFTIIISLGVLNTVLMVVLERTREFGVLRAIGTSPAQVFQLIMLESAFLALLSIAVGTGLGMLSTWYLGTYGIMLSSPLEYGGVLFDRVLARTSLKSILVPGLVVLVSSLLVSVPPAIRAARIVPVKAMRAS